MTLLLKYVTRLDGWSGGPGVNVHHFSQGKPPYDLEAAVQDAYDRLHAMYSGMVGLLITPTVITVDREVTVIEHTTGQIQDVRIVQNPKTDIQGTGIGAAMPRSTMGVVRHSTSTWLNGRRLQGRNFYGPLAESAINTDGLISIEARENLDNYNNGLHSGLGPILAVYHRPAVKGGADGVYADVEVSTALQKPGILRSRRD